MSEKDTKKIIKTIAELLASPYSEDRNLKEAKRLAEENSIPFSEDLFLALHQRATYASEWDSSNCSW